MKRSETQEQAPCFPTGPPPDNDAAAASGASSSTNSTASTGTEKGGGSMSSGLIVLVVALILILLALAGAYYYQNSTRASAGVPHPPPAADDVVVNQAYNNLGGGAHAQARSTGTTVSYFAPSGMQPAVYDAAKIRNQINAATAPSNNAEGGGAPRAVDVDGYVVDDGYQRDRIGTVTARTTEGAVYAVPMEDVTGAADYSNKQQNQLRQQPRKQTKQQSVYLGFEGGGDNETDNV